MLPALLVLIGVALAATYVVKLEASVLAGARIILCVLAMGVALSRCNRLRTLPEADITYDRHSIVGWGLGRELASDLPEGGTVVVMQMARQSPGFIRIADAELEGLKRGVGGVDFRWVFPDTVDEAEKEGDPSRMNRDEALRFLDAIQTADAIATFAPLPLERLVKRGDVPPLYVFDAFDSGYWKPHLEKGTVKVAVTPDPSQAGATEVDGKPQARFDLLFDLHRAP